MITFTQLKKNLKKDFSSFKKIRLAICSDSASQFIHTGIRGYGSEIGINFEIFEADYNQIERQVFDHTSELYAFQPEFIFLHISAEHLLKKFYKGVKASQKNFATEQNLFMRTLYETIQSKIKCRVIINTIPEINDTVFGNFAAKTENSFLFQSRKLNLRLMELAQELKNLFICDISSLQNQRGFENRFDPKMYISADMSYSIEFIPLIAKQLCDIVQAINGTFKKCVILDLDNTTWGGIIGDDGMEGIQIGDLGIGKAFTELQLWIKQLKERGIIVAVCSKNTESIAKEPFEKHPDMVLKLEDIAIFVANWENKVDNIICIQSVLNIGFDSIVFLDDNPFEREMVKSAIPEICIPDLPEDPAEYLVYLRSLNLFETASFTEEDEQRTRQYQEEAKRNILQKSFGSEETFLESLEMKSDVQAFNNFTIPRISQLTQRSNQFNLRTKRYSEEEIRQAATSESHFTLSLTLEDKFGEHGLIAVIILHDTGNDTLFIDTWIMSCRVLKREMERFTLNCIVDLAAKKGFNKLSGEYIPTSKNAIVKDHYESLGFKLSGDLWTLDLENYIEETTFISKK